MKKQTTLCLLLFMLPFLSKAGFIQHLIDNIPAKEFVTPQLFSSKTPDASALQWIKPSVSSFDLLTVNESELQRIVDTKPETLAIKVPIDGVWQTILMKKSNTVDENTVFSMHNETTLEASNYKTGAYYHGVVKNSPNTIAAISFFDHDIIGVIGTDNGNYVVGHSNIHDFYSNEYIVYNDRNLLIPNTTDCATDDDMQMYPVHQQSNISTETITTKCVKVYIECDYQCYLDRGSNTTLATNYATGIFNLTKALYLNDSISTGISQVVVWTSTDPYAAATSTSDALTYFGNAMSGGFNGDLAHLFSTRSLGGGIAWVDVLCYIPSNQTAVSASLGSTLTPLPTYSWNANVVTHEMGHNLGSKHTHSCAWNGNNTRIDNCGGHAGFPSGSCADVTPDPPAGGTMMSYCHLVSVGINFNLGFGPQPGTLIRFNVNNASCLTPCITCNSNISITGTYSSALTESNTWIKSSAQTTILNTAVVKLDANPTAGYILLQPSSNTDFFLASPSSNGSFVAQALDGCAGSTPAKQSSHSGSVLEEDAIDANVILYPNPAYDQLTIECTKANEQIGSYEVYTIEGKKLISVQPITSRETCVLDIKSLVPGIYIIKLQHSSGVEMLKFEKR